MTSYPVRRLKLYGERNSGTNWLEHLVRLNLEVEVLPSVVPNWVRRLERAAHGTEWLRDLWFRSHMRSTLGWKHALVEPDRGDFTELAAARRVGFLCVVKHPAAWLLSLHRRPYNHHWGEPGDLATFARSRWYTVGRERARRSYPNPISLWNAKSAGYLALTERLPGVIVRYEHVLGDPQARLDEISAGFGLRRKTAQFHNDEQSTKRDATQFEEYRRYYTEERWRSKLPPSVAELVADQVDRGLMQRLGYAAFIP